MKSYPDILFLLLLGLSVPVSIAKRAPPKPVTPVVQNGIRYSAPNDNELIGYVVASDSTTGKKLWDIKIFETKIDSHLEEDVQWVFITELRLDGDSLLVKDEKARCYRVELKNKKVEPVICRGKI